VNYPVQCAFHGRGSRDEIGICDAITHGSAMDVCDQFAGFIHDDPVGIDQFVLIFLVTDYFPFCILSIFHIGVLSGVIVFPQ